MTELDVPCPICNAQPGEVCASLVNASTRKAGDPHFRRVLAATQAENVQLREELARVKAQLVAIGGPLP